MKCFHTIFLGILLVSFQHVTYSQERMDIDDSFVIELGLPNGFINAPFKNIMQGLVYVSPMYQYTLKSGISFGAGVHYSYFNV
ncbi:MAG: hypothetical protein RL432_1706, partial [Bacteroidota bacterium]